jgi:hypothetical protein
MKYIHHYYLLKGIDNMSSNDYILRMAESIGDMSAKLLNLKDTRKTEVVQLEALNDSNILKTVIKGLIKSKKLNEAENLLYKALDLSYSRELIDMGLWMYEEFDKIPDGELSLNNFSKEEIIQGIRDLKKVEEHHAI